MGAYQTGLDSSFSADLPPVLVAASSPDAGRRAAAFVEATGARVAAQLSLTEMIGRVQRQAALSALWVELDGETSGELGRLIDAVRPDVDGGRARAIVSTRLQHLDTAMFEAGGIDIDLLVDASEAERAAALAVALSGAHKASRLSDIATDRESARLRQLSDEVNRIASALARLSTGTQSGSLAKRLEMPPPAEAPEISVDQVRAVIRARRLRARFLPEELFADPAWDMLLDLLQAEIAQLRVPVSSLCIAASVPATTALRWLKTMTEQGLFVRRADPHDGRRVFVELAPETSAALRRYFAELGSAAVI